MPPKISVIIATYYRNTLVSDAIESVLEQSYEPVELIVVDDSGERHAAPVLEQYDAVEAIYRETNGGWAAAYTTGIRAASGQFIQLLDDDDYLLPGKLARTAGVLMDDPEVGVVYSGLKQDTLGEVPPDPAVRGDILINALLFQTFPCCTITMLIDRDVLEPSLPLASHADDLNLKIELATRTRFEYVDACLVYRRKEAGRKWDGTSKIREMKACIAHHEDLYAGYPGVKKRVLAQTYVQEGHVYLSQRPWSPRATVCFAKAAYHTERHRLQFVVRVLASIFGRPGIHAVRTLERRLPSETSADRGADG